jgi:hypothetical protein
MNHKPQTTRTRYSPLVHSGVQPHTLSRNPPSRTIARDHRILPLHNLVLPEHPLSTNPSIATKPPETNPVHHRRKPPMPVDVMQDIPFAHNCLPSQPRPPLTHTYPTFHPTTHPQVLPITQSSGFSPATLPPPCARFLRALSHLDPCGKRAHEHHFVMTPGVGEGSFILYTLR